MLVAVFAFGGWTQVTFLAGEAKVDLWRPLAAAILGVTVLYLVAVAAMLMVPMEGSWKLTSLYALGIVGTGVPVAVWRSRSQSASRQLSVGAPGALEVTD